MERGGYGVEDKRKEEGMEWKISGKRRVWSGR